MYRFIILFLFLCSAFFFSPPLQAKGWDRRVALLVVNQTGWKREPFLRYALHGDMKPLAQELRGLGFEVHTLINQTPQTLRQTLQRFQQRFQKAPKVSTFLFYYSGHADPKNLHMGPQSQTPYSYQEFAKVFRKLNVTRRFAIFDACFSGEVIRLFGSLSQYQKLLQEGRVKGVRRRSPINISQLDFPNQGQEQGLRIIASSLQLSWELERYKASVFTYHLLQGLRGKADLDHDGKISVDELFDYASRAVQRVTGQQPQQLVIMQREQPYALAPAYRSRLRIGSDIVGHISVSVANFTWSYHKSKRRPLTLAVVDGQATIQLKRKRLCWRQDVLLPKGGETFLGKQWTPHPCAQKETLLSKGYLPLPARIEPEELLPTHSLSLGVGALQQGLDSLRDTQPQVTLDWRWNWLQLGAHFSHAFLPNRSFSFSRLSLQAALGWPLHVQLQSFRGELFVGAFLSGGLLFQHLPEEQGKISPFATTGGLFSFTWWPAKWGLRLNARAGADYTPTLGQNGFSFLWGIDIAVTFAL
ncbi:MAG: caspase family protein [Myxococcales bacterium]|nr:caspase family protein [Myxococcales bacterium]